MQSLQFYIITSQVGSAENRVQVTEMSPDIAVRMRQKGQSGLKLLD